MSGIEPVVLASIITASAAAVSTGITLIQDQGAGDSVAPKPDTSGELAATRESLANRRALLNRRRGSNTLSLDPATGGATATDQTGLSFG